MKTLRLIGGDCHGQTRSIADSAKQYTATVYDQDVNRTYHRNLQVTTRERSIEYTRRTVTLVGDTFNYQEDCLVWAALTLKEAVTLIAQLPLPKSTVADIEMVPVEGSSLIAAVGYDADLKVLAVRMGVERGTDKGLYYYTDVPAKLAWQFLASASKGTFYNANIKGKFTARKVGN